MSDMNNQHLSPLASGFILPPFNDGSRDFYHPESLLQQFRDKIIFPLQASAGDNPYCLKRPLGVLLFGAPGQGKSFLAECYAKMLGMPYIFANRYMLLEKDSPEISKHFLNLVDSASEKSGTIILENLESFIPHRATINNDIVRLDVANVLDIIRHCREKNVVIIGTTSNPQEIDALIGSHGFLNELIYVPYPDSHTRGIIINRSLSCRPSVEMDIDELADALDGFTVSEILQTIEDAALQCAVSMNPITTNIVLEHILPNKRAELLRTRDKYDKLAKLLNEKGSDMRLSLGFV